MYSQVGSNDSCAITFIFAPIPLGKGTKPLSNELNSATVIILL